MTFSEPKLFLTIVSIAVIAFSSCTKETKIIEKNGGKNEAANKLSVSDESSAAELAQAAEQLLSPYTFMLAYKISNQALQKDPQNLKAQFYYLFLKRFEAFRGYYFRVQGMLTTAERADILKQINDMPKSPLKDYLVDTSKPIFRTESDIQAALDEYFNASNEFRKFLKDNEEKEFEIQLNPYVFDKSIRENLIDSCRYEENDGQFSLKCDRQNIAIKKLNTADFIYLRQLVSGEILYGALLNSYSADGLRATQASSDYASLTPENKIKRLLASGNLGKYRKTSLFTNIPSLGSDLVAATEWALKYQSELCQPRKDYLAGDAWCIQDQTNIYANIEIAKSLLSGITRVDLKIANSNAKMNTQVNLLALLNSPIQDLRTVAPVKYNNCGLATELPDNTLQGLFPENNASLFVLDTNCK